MDAKKESKDGLSLSCAPNSLKFNDVSFRYGTRTLVLDKVNFSAESGQTVCFVGQSGCGKSTIAKLIVNMYTPENGTILINGYDINKLSLEWIRNHIVYIPQRPFLFSDSIKNNLYFGLKQEQRLTDDELGALLKRFGCGFVYDLPLGINSIIEENGSNLSGGQVQRLAIIRAILRNPQILILDESTSALDFENESLIYEKLRDYNPKMILIVITHRINSIKNADKTYYVKDGKAFTYDEHSN